MLFARIADYCILFSSKACRFLATARSYLVLRVISHVRPSYCIVHRRLSRVSHKVRRPFVSWQKITVITVNCSWLTDLQDPCDKFTFFLSFRITRIYNYSEFIWHPRRTIIMVENYILDEIIVIVFVKSVKYMPVILLLLISNNSYTLSRLPIYSRSK